MVLIRSMKINIMSATTTTPTTTATTTANTRLFFIVAATIYVLNISICMYLNWVSLQCSMLLLFFSTLLILHPLLELKNVLSFPKVRELRAYESLVISSSHTDPLGICKCWYTLVTLGFWSWLWLDFSFIFIISVFPPSLLYTYFLVSSRNFIFGFISSIIFAVPNEAPPWQLTTTFYDVNFVGKCRKMT